MNAKQVTRGRRLSLERLEHRRLLATYYLDPINGSDDFTCYRPNCHRTFDRIMTVWIWGAKTRLYRIVENFGEDGAGSPDLIAVVVSAVSVGRTDRFRRSVREVCYSNGNDRIGWLGVGRGVLPAVAP